MNRKAAVGCLLLSMGLLTATVSSPVFALGSKEKSPEEEAAEAQKKATAKYNDGVKKIDRARKFVAEGNAGKAKKEFEKAAKRFKEALEYQPDFPEAWNNLGFSLRLSGRFDEALVHYNRAIELKPDFMEAHEYRGRAYLALDSVKLAKAEYEWLLEQKHAEEAAALKEAIDAWVVARAEGKTVSVEKLKW